MKIIHLVDAKSEVINNYIDFVEKNLQYNNYYFPIGNIEEQDKLFIKYKNVIKNNFIFNRKEIRKSLKSLIDLVRVLENYDIVVWHSLFLIKDVVYLFSIFNINIARKSVWIEWGADLYEYKSKICLLNSIYKHFVKNLMYIISIFPGDIDQIRRIFNYKGKILDGCYPPSSFEGVKIQKRIKSENNKIVIMIGHSTNKSLNHIGCLEKIKKFSGKNIEVFLPLNYGDLDYANKVIEYAKNNFNLNELNILKDYILLQEYNRLLEKVDICIFDTKRQLGLGNLYTLLAMNKCLYLNEDGVMYKFLKKIGIDVKQISNIDTINEPNELIFGCNNASNEYIVNRFNEKYYIEVWKNIFDNITLNE